MKLIAIDGACRGNGTADCIAAGGVLALDISEDMSVDSTYTLSTYEVCSTNQRGELLALLTALHYLRREEESALIVTDSEYIFNAMTKGWIPNWVNKHWLTALGEEVKNKDLWEEIHAEGAGLDVQYYHIKGHCMPFGAVTAKQLLTNNPTAFALLSNVLNKYDNMKDKLASTTLAKANELSIKNNGYALEDNILRLFVCANITVDAVATRCVDIANRL